MAPGARLRVLIADDQVLMRTGFRYILEASDIDVVGEAGDGLEAVTLAARLRPDVVLMDIRMPRLDGIEATRRVTAGAGTPRVLVLTTFDLDEYVYGALRAGASGFLLKDSPPEELLHAIRVVADGDALVAPAITRRLLEEFAARPDPAVVPAELETLTEREREVLVLVARGLSNTEIADELFLGETTVKTHLGHVVQKLGLRDRVAAVVLAYEVGLISPGDPGPRGPAATRGKDGTRGG